MIIGYILSDENVSFDENVFKKITKLDYSKPILIVGWRKAKALFPMSFNVNSKVIKENVCWTTSPIKDRYQCLEDVESFYNHCIDYQVSKFDYKFCDLFLEKYSSDFKDVRYTLSSSLYVYIIREKSVSCYDLEQASILGYNILHDLKNFGSILHPINPLFKHLNGYKKMCF